MHATGGVYSVMFEQSLVLPTPDNKRWTFALSLTLQVAAIALLMLLPLIYTEQLSHVFANSTPLPPPPMPPAVTRTVTQAATRSARVFTPLTAFLAHRTAAKPLSEIAAFEDAPAQVCVACVVGGTGVFIGGGGLETMTRVEPPPPPAPPPVVERKPLPSAKPLPIGGDVLAASIIRRVLPVYPALAKQARVSGTVRLLGTISKSGSIQQLQVLSGHPLLVNAALDAVRQWVYRPTLLNGVPVDVSAPIDVTFTLSN